jgi:hypothetical protein
MSCDDTRRRLTAYLDGDLDPDGGTLVRGHLRGCAACRQVASDEAALRDGLRALPSLDPPSTLWSGVQAALAAAEEAESRRPRWRRALARWAPAMPRFATGGLVAAAAVTTLWWRTNRGAELPPEPPARSEPALVAATRSEFRSSAAQVQTAPVPSCNTAEAGDVTADLGLDDARRSGCYAAAVERLLAGTGDIRAQWTAAQRAEFDAQVAALRKEIGAAAGRRSHRAWWALMRYLENALARDEVVALASGGLP